MAENDHVSHRNYFKLIKRLSKTSDNQLQEEADRLVDLDNLSRYIFAIIFCGDDDWEKQGAAILNNNTPYAKWYWILWDMDHSFSDYLPGNKKRKPWDKPGLKLVLKSKASKFNVRQYLFRRLLLNNSVYRQDFIRLSTLFLNHLLTKEFLTERCKYYEKMAEDFGTDYPFNPQMKDFLLNRPGFILKDIQVRLGLGKIFTCTYEGPQNIAVTIDGYPGKSGYSSKYFENSLIRIVGNDTGTHLLSHWLVNGKKINGKSIELKVNKDIFIKAIFKE